MLINIVASYHLYAPIGSMISERKERKNRIKCPTPIRAESIDSIPNCFKLYSSDWKEGEEFSAEPRQGLVEGVETIAAMLSV